MVPIQSWQRRSWGFVGGIAAAILGVLVALITGHMAVLLIALVAAGLTATLLVQPHIAPREQATPVRTAALEPMQQRLITTADGTPQAAFALDLPADEGYTTVLTKVGYVIVDTAGRVVYTCKR